MASERNGNGAYRMFLVAALTLFVGLSGGYLLRKTESMPVYSKTEIDAKVTSAWLANAELVRRLEVAEKYADEYRRDVSQINGRIAVIESKVTMILERKGG